MVCRVIDVEEYKEVLRATHRLIMSSRGRAIYVRANLVQHYLHRYVHPQLIGRILGKLHKAGYLVGCGFIQHTDT